MTPDQIGLVEQSFQMVRPMKGQVGGFFFSRLFETAPSAQPLFRRANMTSQSLKLMATLNLFIRLLRTPEGLRAAARELGQRHIGYGARPEHYQAFREALLWTLGQCLGAAFDDETRDAWSAAYDLIAEAMISADATSELVTTG